MVAAAARSVAGASALHRPVDATCARTFNAGTERRRRYAEEVAGRPDADSLVTAFYVSWHTAEHRELRALGE